ncbi:MULTISPECIES: AlpA family phage regulatory protein [unclassified Variovorax]|nr:MULTISPECIES: AlpA family phage regulatory protein [unclassified Variovorax]
MWRIEATKAFTGHRSHASIYTQIREGLFTKAVPIGARSVGWPSHEVEAISAARCAGKTNDEIRALVRDLHAQRQQAAQPGPAQHLSQLTAAILGAASKGNQKLVAEYAAALASVAEKMAASATAGEVAA